MPEFPTTGAALWASVLAIGLTGIVYLAGRAVYRRSGFAPVLLPVLTGSAVVIAVLMLSHTPYPLYFEATGPLRLFLGPAIVALAVPLYGQLPRLRKMWLPVCVAVLAGSVTAIVTGVALGAIFGASREMMLSLAPKSATMPIAMIAAERIGGVASLAGVAVAVTGIVVVIFANPLLDLLRIHDPVVRAFALGTTAHALGTARALQVSDAAGAFAAMAMGLNGILTAMLLPLLAHALHAMGLG
jgi:predicted murein hydrolase (TIGR00659 family)